MEKELRLFYALWPDTDTRQALVVLQKGIVGRKTKAEQLHITLSFLGNQPVSQLATLQAVLESIKMPSFPIKIDQLGYFSKAKIAWAGLQKHNESLMSLHRHLIKALNEHRISFNQNKQFIPHITLARNAKRPYSLKPDPIVWFVNRIALVESRRIPRAKGSVLQYVLLADQKLTE